MTTTGAIAEGVRSQWLSNAVRECQSLLNQSLSAGPNQVPVMAHGFLERLGEPRTPLEKLVVRGLLLEVAVQFGHAAYKTFHRQYPEERDAATTCPFRPSSAFEEWPRDLTHSPAEAFRRWAARYAAGFRAAHPLACAREAEQHIRRHFRSPIAAGDLARTLACPVAF